MLERQVQKSVLCAQHFGKRVVPRCGGHSFEGALPCTIRKLVGCAGSKLVSYAVMSVHEQQSSRSPYLSSHMAASLYLKTCFKGRHARVLWPVQWSPHSKHQRTSADDCCKPEAQLAMAIGLAPAPNPVCPDAAGYSVLNGVVVVDLSRMNSVTVRLRQRVWGMSPTGFPPTRAACVTCVLDDIIMVCAHCCASDCKPPHARALLTRLGPRKGITS